MGYLEGAIRQRYTLKRAHIVYWNKSRRLGACPTMKIIIYATTRRRSVLTDREVQGLNVSSGGASISDFLLRRSMQTDSYSSSGGAKLSTREGTSLTFDKAERTLG